MPDTGAPYFIPFADPTDLVRDWPDLSEDVALAIVAALENIPVVEKRIETFTGSGTWTVPAGVTYAIAYMTGGGGGGAGLSLNPPNAAAGTASSVAFASGTVSAPGGPAAVASPSAGSPGKTPPANTGRGGSAGGGGGLDGDSGNQIAGGNGGYIVAGAEVTPAASITVTVGSGGARSTVGSPLGTDGATGFVYIEYYEEV